VKGIISVFGSSAPEPDSPAYAQARTVGRLLAEAGFAVSTGGYQGTMSAVSQGAADAGGRVIGVTSRRIEDFRGTRVNPWVTEVFHYESLAERVLHLVTHNDGMIVLPGGVGTLSELALAWSFLQVGEIERRPLVLLGDMWRKTIDSFASAYVPVTTRDLVRFADTPAAAVALLIESGEW
jgi:uncharacterized protein (TIGR00730 family)